jgi:hypothetical protein
VRDGIPTYEAFPVLRHDHESPWVAAVGNLDPERRRLHPNLEPEVVPRIVGVGNSTSVQVRFR